jgi:SAM-dependent methyltransferase
VNTPEITAYSQAVGSGQYVRSSGLDGKYDNVRLFWEDQTTRLLLRNPVERTVEGLRAADRGLRLLDLGCGSGDGFDTLLNMTPGSPDPVDPLARVVPLEQLERYTGVDINMGLLEQARQRFSDKDRMSFLQADLREGLPFLEDEAPYDIYFTSFGTLSHFGEDDTVRILADIVRHADHGALIVGDWLGRYAYEWTDLWDDDLSREKWMDYRISYIYPPEERDRLSIDGFDLRLLTAAELRRSIAAVTQATGARLVEAAFFDRSVFVGRHMETGDYSAHPLPLRSHVNRLHDPESRTDLRMLQFELDSLPEGFAGARDILTGLHASWNGIVRFVEESLAALQRRGSPPPGTDITDTAIPDPGRKAIERLGRTFEVASRLEFDDVRAQLIEPQLGFALRDLEIAHQRGRGHGHGLVGAWVVHKA